MNSRLQALDVTVNGKAMLAGVSNEASGGVTLARLQRLRWVAVAGQLATVAFVAAAGIDLPVYVLLAFIGIAGVSNLLFPALRRKFENRQPQKLLTITLIFDTLLLTAMIYWSGGPHNPFTSFYLLHLIVGSLALDARRAWLLMAICAGCFALLFFSPHPLDMPHTHLHEITTSVHLEGMLVAFVLTGFCINYFTINLRRALRQREAELGEMQTRALQSERLASLARLAAGVAHELSTPLATIAVVSKDLERSSTEVESANEIHEDAKLIQAEVRRCGEILGRLNQASTSGIGDAPEWLTPTDLIAGLMKTIPPAVGRALTIENLTDGQHILAPREPLIQALVTLTKNASEAVRPGAPVHLRMAHSSSSMCFEVRDEGSGISPEIAERIGQPFFSTKEPGRGMGLGLFLVRTLAVQLGGELIITSEPGLGSTFKLIIPSQPPNQHAEV